MMRDRTGVRWSALAALLAVVATACGGVEERSSAPPQTPPEVGFPPWATAPAVRARPPAVDVIAYESGGVIWVVNPDGTGRKRLTEGMPTDGAGLSWSPDGTRIAFSRATDDIDRWQIHAVNADGTGLTRLTHEVDICPTWSPDGTRIAFSRVTDDWNRWEIYAVNADGTDLKRLAGSVFGGCPAWSPDGMRIAIVTERTPRDRQVSVINADETEVKAINSEFAVRASNVHWSPDGTEVIFIRLYGRKQGLYAMDVNSGEPRLLHPLFGHWSEKEMREKWVEWGGETGVLAISPDGSKIAIPADFFVAHCDGTECETVIVNTEIFVVNADGSDLTRLTRHRARDASPSWSPDGTRIAFVSRRHGTSSQIFVMNADGSGVTQLTFDRDSPADSLTWSSPSRP